MGNITLDMEKFIKPVALLKEICEIVESAEKYILIVCPYLQLNHHLQRELSKHKKNESLEITILYGKFSNNTNFQIDENDLVFLKSFQNIRVLYHKRLHAKFYSNEKIALVTTLNINNYSPNDNLEYGIRFDGELHPMSLQVKSFIQEIIDDSEVVYESFSVSQTSTSQRNSIAIIKAKFSNAYEKWTKDEDDNLAVLFKEQKNISQLSTIFKRQPSAIESRIKKLELKKPF